MATHRILVMMQAPDFSWWRAGALVDYDGPDNWKLEPLDPVQREAWERTISDPDRVAEAVGRTAIGGAFPDGESVFAPDGGAELPRFPTSGWVV
ncbi:hypothetical protein [Novosphingobium sp. CECT 9465]|uniref:hypothetical protein n=1 Tax=Novosphingobium sp. CECT 9465 TaxID=2829794 RepID=UPI001E4BCCFA|nr:hypothetical protein [Novosphingobium sp. CECT 9465]CAH0496610.1 hypothetical protein NVSP9465_01647 [Novosphingobium sp. CECT 9465]